jgi:hypothetical protein
MKIIFTILSIVFAFCSVATMASAQTTNQYDYEISYNGQQINTGISVSQYYCALQEIVGTFNYTQAGAYLTISGNDYIVGGGGNSQALQYIVIGCTAYSNFLAPCQANSYQFDTPLCLTGGSGGSNYVWTLNDTYPLAGQGYFCNINGLTGQWLWSYNESEVVANYQDINGEYLETWDKNPAVCTYTGCIFFNYNYPTYPLIYQQAWTVYGTTGTNTVSLPPANEAFCAINTVYGVIDSAQFGIEQGSFINENPSQTLYTSSLRAGVASPTVQATCVYYNPNQ